MKSIRSALLYLFGGIYMLLFLIWAWTSTHLFKSEKVVKSFRVILKGFFKVIFVNVKVSGTENINKNKTYIFMGNHISMLDMPLVLGFIPVYFRAFEASSHFKTPFYGSILRSYGNLPMERTNPKASMKSILKGVDILKEGTSMVILPEGTRTTTSKMGNFKKFPFLLAKKSGANIIPFGMSGLWEVNNKTSWHVNPGKVDLKFGKEISAEEIAKLDIDNLKNLTRDKIKELVDRP